MSEIMPEMSKRSVEIRTGLVLFFGTARNWHAAAIQNRPLINPCLTAAVSVSTFSRQVDPGFDGRTLTHGAFAVDIRHKMRDGLHVPRGAGGNRLRVALFGVSSFEPDPGYAGEGTDHAMNARDKFARRTVSHTSNVAKADKQNAMTLGDFNRVCGDFRHTNHVVQWGGADVWKIATKVFAIGRRSDGGDVHITFKCSALSFAILKDLPGLRPAPYLASRGLTWIQRTSSASMDAATLNDYLVESYRLASLGLPKGVQKQLGLNQV